MIRAINVQFCNTVPSSLSVNQVIADREHSCLLVRSYFARSGWTIKLCVLTFFTHTRTIILLLFWNLSGTTRVSRYQNGKNQGGKTNLDLPEQEIVSGSGICSPYASLHLIPDNHANIPPLSFWPTVLSVEPLVHCFVCLSVVVCL